MVITFSIGVLPQNTTPVRGEEDLQKQLDEIEEKKAAIGVEKDKLAQDIANKEYVIDGYSEQIARIHGEVLIFQKEIDLLQLEIQGIEVNISLLEEQIEENIAEIERITKDVVNLETESKARIEDNYIKFRLNSSGSITETNIFTTENVNEYFKDSQYISIIQEDTNRIMLDLSDLKDELELKKKELDEKLIEVKKEKERVLVKQSDLEKKRDEIDQKKNAYYVLINERKDEINSAQSAIAVFSEEEATLNSEAEKIRQQIFNSYNPVNSGEWVTAGRPIGNQGCTGLCTGPHLHFMVANNGQWVDPCGYLKPGGPVAGCGWGDRLDWPVSGTVYYTSSFGNRCFKWNGADYCDFHAAIDLAAQPVNAVVFAAHDGYAYKGTDGYGANYVIICENTDCNQGIKTGYWHLSNF